MSLTVKEEFVRKKKQKKNKTKKKPKKKKKKKQKKKKTNKQKQTKKKPKKKKKKKKKQKNYNMTIHHERILPDPAGIEPATSLSLVRRASDRATEAGYLAVVHS